MNRQKQRAGSQALGRALFFLFSVSSCGKVSSNSNVRGSGGAGVAGTSPESGGAAGLDEVIAPSSGGAGCTGPVEFGSQSTVPAADPEVTRGWRWQACGTIPPEVHDTAVQALFPPTGNAVAVLYADGSVLLQPTTTPGEATVLRPSGGAPVQAIAFSPDAKQLGEVNQGTVQVRQLESGGVSTLATSTACTGSSLRFSADGNYVLAWDLDTLCVWQLSDGTLLNTWLGNFNSAALSNGRLLTVEPTVPPALRSWPLQGGASSLIPLQLPDGMTFDNPSTVESASVVQLSPRGDTLVAVVTAQDAASGESAHVLGLWSTDGTFRASFANTSDDVAFSESGAFIFAGQSLVEVGTNQPLFTGITVGAQTVDTSGTLVAATVRGPGGSDAVQVFDLSGATAPRLLSTLPSTAIVNGLAVSPDGKQLAVANYFGATLFELAPEFSASQAVFNAGPDFAADAHFTARGQTLVVAGDGWQTISTSDGASVCGNDPSPDADSSSRCEFTSARPSPLEDWISVGGYDRSLNVFSLKDCAEGQPRPSLSGELVTQRCNVRSAFSADQELLVTSGPELYRTCDWSRLWPTSVSAGDPDLLQDVAFFPGEEAILASKCASPTNDPLRASVCDYSQVSVTDGMVIQNLPSLHAPRAAISSEGHWIAAGGVLLHLPSGDVLEFEPQARISTFTPNGDIIAVLADNSIARYCRTP